DGSRWSPRRWSGWRSRSSSSAARRSRSTTASAPERTCTPCSTRSSSPSVSCASPGGTPEHRLPRPGARVRAPATDTTRSAQMATEVRHEPEASRYVIVVDGEVKGRAAYRLRGDDEIVFPHTVIAPDARGHGLGAELVRRPVHRHEARLRRPAGAPVGLSAPRRRCGVSRSGNVGGPSGGGRRMTDEQWGPLAALAGTWRGDEGLDVAWSHAHGASWESPY